MHKKISLLSVAVFFATCLLAQQPTVESLNSIIPVDPNIKIGKMENGLTYYIRKNSKPESRAELRLVVKAGSILEDDDQVGLAHFMEHMEFNGTKNFAKNDLVKYLQSIGVKFGADLNAYTSFDETVYILPVPTDDEKILTQSFQILEDWTHNATLSHEEIDNERGVVIEEWRTGRGANQRMRDINLPVLLHGSHYAKRLPIGTLDNLENFKYESLERFYKDWYRPNLMAVVAIGDFDVEDIEQRIQTHFSKLKNPTGEKERKEFAVPDHEETLVTIASDEEATFSTISLYIKNDTEPEVTFQDYYNNLLNTFYTGMLNLRLQEISQKPSAPFIYAGTSYGDFIGDKTAFTASANVKEGDLLKGFESVLIECERAKQYGFTEGELERFKMNYLSFYEQAYNERDKSQSRNYAAEYIRNFLKDEPIPGIELEYAFAKKYIPQITLEEITALGDKFFRADNRVVVVNAPKKDGYTLPSEAEVLEVVEKASKTHVSPYMDELASTELIGELPAPPGSVTDVSKKESIGITEITLSNGVQIILKPTDFKNDQILMTAWSDGGSSIYSDEDYPSASNADAVVNECGIGGFSPTDLQKLLAGKNANASPYIGVLGEGLNGSCTPKDIETMFQLIYLNFTSPNKNKDLFDSFIEKNKALYKNLLSNPTYYFYNERAKILSQNNPRGGQFPTEEDWDKVDFDRTIEIYKERFANAADFKFIFVGNFNVDSIQQYLTKYIAILPSSDERETWKDLGIRAPQGVIKKDIRKGSDPKSSVYIRFHGPYHYDRKTNHQIKSLADVMNISLIEKIREEQGGVYGINASSLTQKFPYENFAMAISFPCKPENADTLSNAVFGVIKDIQIHGVSDDYFEKVVETQMREMQVNIKENGYWMSAIKQSYEYGYDPEEIPDYQSRIDELTKEDLQKVAEKYLDFNSLILLRLLPEK